MSITSLVEAQDSLVIKPTRFRVKIMNVTNCTDHYDGAYMDWPEAFVERIILREGPVPSQAIITVATPRYAGSDDKAIFSHVLTRSGSTPTFAVNVIFKPPTAERSSTVTSATPANRIPQALTGASGTHPSPPSPLYRRRHPPSQTSSRPNTPPCTFGRDTRAT